MRKGKSAEEEGCHHSTSTVSRSTAKEIKENINNYEDYHCYTGFQTKFGSSARQAQQPVNSTSLKDISLATPKINRINSLFEDEGIKNIA
jgi:hypothetical protein